MVERLREGEIILPTVFVDGERVSAGYLDYFTIVGAVEKARVNGNGSDAGGEGDAGTS